MREGEACWLSVNYRGGALGKPLDFSSPNRGVVRWEMRGLRCEATAELQFDSEQVLSSAEYSFRCESSDEAFSATVRSQAELIDVRIAGEELSLACGSRYAPEVIVCPL